MKILNAIGAIALFAGLTVMLLIGGRPKRAAIRFIEEIDAHYASKVERD